MKRKKTSPRKKTDMRLAAPFPTAESSEFVPLPTDLQTAPAQNSRDIYDFIPAPKQKKYGE